MTLTVPTSFREACQGPRSTFRTQADDDAYKVRMEEALKDCDGRRAGAVEIIDGANEALKPKRKLFGFTLKTPF